MTRCGVVLILLGVVISIIDGTLGMLFLPGILGVALIIAGYLRGLRAAIERR